jgi:uncharacterized protein
VKLENEFVVPAPVERAWEVMLDIEKIAPCLPGATVEKANGGRYEGTMTVKLGPIVNRYNGTLEIQESDEAARRAVLSAKAREARGQGTASATITSTLESVDDGTRVKVETDVRITGPAAQFGRGVMQDVSAKLMRDFADCLAQRMAEPDGAADGKGSPEAAEAAAKAGKPEAGKGKAAAGKAAAGKGKAGAEGTTEGTTPATGEAAGEGTSAGDPSGAGTAAGEGTSEETPPAAGEAAGKGTPPGTGEAATAEAETAEAAAASESRPAPEASDGPRAPDVLDLGAASREAVLKRAAPIVAGAVAVVFVLLRLRRR